MLGYVSHLFQAFFIYTHMQKIKIQSGEYAAFLNPKNEIIGGCIFFNIDKKNDKIYWTSNWWIFKDIRDIKVEFYKAEDNALKLICINRAVLNISHNVKLGLMNKGNIQISCN